MKSIFLLFIFISLPAVAGLEKLTVQNLDLEYEAPYGKGTADKVGIGVSMVPEALELEIVRSENAFEVTTPYMDFTWTKPLKFIYELEKISAKKTSASLGTKTHFVESDYVMIRPKESGEYKAEKIKGNCSGSGEGDFEVRLLEDCRTKMDLTINRIDVPRDFILYKLLEGLPRLPSSELDIPGDHVILSTRDGQYSFQVYIQYWVRAGVRSWGRIQYENDHKIVAIKVDQIKFGYLTVTDMVMRKLKQIIKNPDVKIDPPWIRINIEKYREIQSK